MKIKKLRNWKLQIFFLIAAIALISGCSHRRKPSASFTEPPSAPPASISTLVEESSAGATREPSEPPKTTAAPTAHTGAQSTITLRIDFGDDRIPLNFQFPISNFQTPLLWLIMQQTLTEKGIALEYEDYGEELGVLITKIGDKKNGEGGRYWQYFVNGKYATVGASNYRVKAEDVVEWRFTNSKFKSQNAK